MYLLLRLLLPTLLALGCSDPSEKFPAKDAGGMDAPARPDGLVSPDQTIPADITITPDQSVPTDIAITPDQVIPADIMITPDKSVPADITITPDKLIPADIKIAPDQPVPPDKSVPIPTNTGSCKALRAATPSITSGVYTIAPKKGGASIKVYCDMTTSGGGWTLAAAQFEKDQMVNWGEGIQSDYDPGLGTSKSFSLNSAQLPAHTQTAFGKDLVATFIGYSDFVYHTGDIPKTAVKNYKDSKNYHIHRAKGHTYGSFNPDGNPVYSSWCPKWCNALVYDISPGAFTWTFAPYASIYVRGYGMAGKILQNSSESYAWTVWVR